MAFGSGTASIKHHGLVPIETPLGGVKDSGYGTEGGTFAIRSFLQEKMVARFVG